MKIKPLVGDFIETTRQVSSYLFLGSIAFGLATEDSLLWIPSFITAAGLNIFGNEKQMNFSKIKIKGKEYPTSITILARVSEDSFIVEKDRDVPIFKTFQNHDLYGQVNSIAEKELNIYNTNVSHEDIVKEGLITINGETTYNYLFLIDDFTLDNKKEYFADILNIPLKKHNNSLLNKVDTFVIGTSIAFTNSMIYHYLKSDMSNSINAAVGAAVSLTATVGLYMYEQYKRKKQGILMNKNVEVESSTLRS